MLHEKHQYMYEQEVKDLEKKIIIQFITADWYYVCKFSYSLMEKL